MHESSGKILSVSYLTIVIFDVYSIMRLNVRVPLHFHLVSFLYVADGSPQSEIEHIITLITSNAGN